MSQKAVSIWESILCVQDPERVLDCPGLVPDYYINILDWSSTNTVWGRAMQDIDAYRTEPQFSVFCVITYFVNHPPPVAEPITLTESVYICLHFEP